METITVRYMVPITHSKANELESYLLGSNTTFHRTGAYLSFGTEEGGKKQERIRAILAGK